ncbi:MAG: ParB/RepB/Spo0J family partition protein [Candidatus Sedimenticola sp. (ex Thyasira tokunagai)]
MENIIMQPGVVAHLPLDRVERDPDQPRIDFPQKELHALAADIGLRQVRQPITVRPHPEKKGHWMIKMGERRWRGSRIAKQQTIPALLDETDDNDSPLDRFLDQVKENFLREDLNPIEWSRVLRRLRDDHEIPVHQISTTLKENGLKGMGRSQVSNLIRLTEAPEWAQKMILSGDLTAAHGKALLAARGVDEVLNDVRYAIERYKRDDEVLTVARLEGDIADAFHDNCTYLDSSETRFDTEHCKRCHQQRKVSGSRYCLSPECYNKKQEEAPAKEQKETKGGGKIAPAVGRILSENPEIIIAPHKQGLSGQEDYKQLLGGAAFDKSGCVGCASFRRIKWTEEADDEGSPACFDLSCFDTKQRASKAIENREYKLETLLNDYLRLKLKEDLAGDESLIWQLITYLALQQPAGMHESYGGTEYLRTANDNQTEKRLNALTVSLGWTTLDNIIDDISSTEKPNEHAEDPGYLIACAGLDSMGPEPLRSLAKRRDIDLDQFQMGAEFFALYKGEELNTWLERMPAVTDDARTAWAKLNDKHKRLELVQIAGMIQTGAPEEILSLYQPMAEEFAELPDAETLAIKLIEKTMDKDGQLDFVAGDHIDQLINDLTSKHPDVDGDYWESVQVHIEALGQ